MEINLNSEKEIILNEESSINTDSIILNQITDNYTSVSAIIGFTDSLYTKTITLWEGEEYEEIGQYTDEDIINRLKEIL